MNKPVKKISGRILLNNKGFSLLELMIVSSFILLFLGASALYGNKFIANDELVSSQKALLSINSDTRSSFKGRGNFLGLTNVIANNLGIFPPDMVNGTGATLTVQNKYNGTVTLQVNASNNLLQEQIWGGIPKEACMKLALFSPDTWITVDVNGTAIDPNADTAMTDVDGACNLANNTLTWNSN